MSIPSKADLTEIYRELDLRLDASLGACLRGADGVSLLFSGGVDSSILACSLRDRPGTELLVLSVVGGRDESQARSAARLLGLGVRHVALRESDVNEALHRHGREVEHLPEPVRGVQLALSLALRAATAPLVLAGQGADELFGGYSHFRGLPDLDADRRRSHDLHQLLDEDWPLSRRLASYYGRTLRSPFLEEPFVSFASRLPLERVEVGFLTKPLLRGWAAHRGLPELISLRPKLAIQYGSGIEKLLRHSASPGPKLAAAESRRVRP